LHIFSSIILLIFQKFVINNHFALSANIPSWNYDSLYECHVFVACYGQNCISVKLWIVIRCYNGGCDRVGRICPRGYSRPRPILFEYYRVVREPVRSGRTRSPAARGRQTRRELYRTKRGRRTSQLFALPDLWSVTSRIDLREKEKKKERGGKRRKKTISLLRLALGSYLFQMQLTREARGRTHGKALILPEKRRYQGEKTSLWCH